MATKHRGYPTAISHEKCSVCGATRSSWRGWPPTRWVLKAQRLPFCPGAAPDEEADVVGEQRLHARIERFVADHYHQSYDEWDHCVQCMAHVRLQVWEQWEPSDSGLLSKTGEPQARQEVT